MRGSPGCKLGERLPKVFVMAPSDRRRRRERLVLCGLVERDCEPLRGRSDCETMIRLCVQVECEAGTVKVIDLGKLRCRFRTQTRGRVCSGLATERWVRLGKEADFALKKQTHLSVIFAKRV